MNRDTEFRQWGIDIKAKLPQVGEYIWSLSEAARDEWYNTIFAEHELQDAIAMNSHMQRTGEGIETYARDKLPRTFIKLLQEIRYERLRRKQKRAILSSQEEAKIGVGPNVRKDAVMSQMLRFVEQRKLEYRESTGNSEVPDELFSRWAQEASDMFDRKDVVFVNNRI